MNGTKLIEVSFEGFVATFFFYGACTRKRGENGLAAWGAIGYDMFGEVIYEGKGEVEVSGEVTNNIAESFSLL